MPGAALPALTGDALQWVTDHDAYTFTTPGNGDAYRALIVSYPYIAEAMAYSSRHVDLRTGTGGIWDKIDGAAELGYVNTVAVPVDHPASANTARTYYARQEAINTYAAKVAHALWLEVTGAVPWHLTDYGLNELKYILHTDWLFNIVNPGVPTPTWDLAATPAAMQYRMCDHSPKDVYDVATGIIAGAVTKTDAIGKIIYWGQTYNHLSASPSRVISVWETDKSTGGCSEATLLASAICRAVNIAPRWYVNKYISTAHASLSMLTRSGEGYVLGHSDDFYSAQYAGTGAGKVTGAVPNVRRAELFSVWDPIIGQETDRDTIDYNVGRLRALKQGLWPTPDMQTAFDYNPPNSQGWFYFTYAQGLGSTWKTPYLTVDEQNTAYDSIAARSGVTGLPPKPSAANTGTSGGLTPESGNLTIDDTWIGTNGNTYQNKDHSGTITVSTSSTVFIKNCRIDGGGGVGITLSNPNYCWINNCEILNCTNGIKGTPAIVYSSYIHDCSSDAVLLDSQSLTAVEECRLGGNYITAPSGTTAVHVTTGMAQPAFMVANTITSSSTTVPVILVDGTPSDRTIISYNWLDGGQQVVKRNQFSAHELQIDNNLFGRTSVDALFTNVVGGAPTWNRNRYEDDLSVANPGDDPTP